MNHVLSEMLNQYRADGLTDKKNAVKEIMQEIVLCGLSRAGFFQKAAFYGGTALRIFYGLDRFSEDLDFSLVTPDPTFDLPAYFPTLRKEVASYGLNVEISEKEKTKESAIQSAFLKGNTKEHLLLFYASDPAAAGIPGSEKIKIKFEVDTNPPAGASFDHKYRLLPAPYEITLYDMPSLFAGKAHAVICRAWKSRVKGRDLYDYVFYLSQGTPVNLRHLNARLVDSGFDGAREDMTLEEIKDILHRRFESIDYDQARQDVLPFIKNPSAVEIWSKDFFIAITDNLSARG